MWDLGLPGTPPACARAVHCTAAQRCMHSPPNFERAANKKVVSIDCSPNSTRPANLCFYADAACKDTAPCRRGHRTADGQTHIVGRAAAEAVPGQAPEQDVEGGTAQSMLPRGCSRATYTGASNRLFWGGCHIPLSIPFRCFTSASTRGWDSRERVDAVPKVGLRPVLQAAATKVAKEHVPTGGNRAVGECSSGARAHGGLEGGCCTAGSAAV